jgi:hypothetical protein
MVFAVLLLPLTGARKRNQRPSSGPAVTGVKKRIAGAEGDLDAEMVAIAGAIIRQRTGNFDPSTYRDRYQEALQQLIEAKMKGVMTCNLSGANAFFASSDLEDYFTVYPIDKLYQPLRTNLRFLASGHPPSLKWLKASLASESRVRAAAL